MKAREVKHNACAPNDITVGLLPLMAHALIQRTPCVPALSPSEEPVIRDASVFPSLEYS